MTGRVSARDGSVTDVEGPCPSARRRARSWRIRCAWIAALLVVAGTLAAVARASDPTDSILSYGCDPPLPRTAANCDIWHTSLVNLRWTIIDPNFVPVAGTSCDTTTISTDTPGTNVTCAVQNGSTQVQKTVTLRVDQTGPTVTGATASRTADQNGWWNHAVNWAFAGTDATSGLASCDTVAYSGPDGAAADVAGACRDVAGNSTTGHKAIKYDATAPSMTGATPSRAADQNGWWNHAVNWAFAGNDATSGLASCDTVAYSGPDSGTGDVAGACRDNAGNAATLHQAIKYDATAPSVTGATPSRAADQNGWWNHSVSWAFAGSDATSGVASCDTVSYPGPDSGTGDVAGACRDNAGNSATGHKAIKYDATSPSVTGAPARPADQNGWWNHAVNVAFTGSDATSGIDSCDTVGYSGPDTASTTVAGGCRDIAGNAANKQVAIKYDATAPSVTGATPARPADQNGWWNHSVAWTFAGSDATSGVSSCDTVTYSGPDGSAGDVAGACRDAAGNAATGHKAIKYDATAPSVTGAPARPADRDGWWNHAVNVAFTGTDATSGIDSCDTVGYSGPDTASTTVAGGCRDIAGNAANKQVAIKYDATAPTLTGATPDRPADSGAWWNHPVGWTFHASDATSGVADSDCDTTTYAGADTTAASVSGGCRDRAGNGATTQSGSFKYDATPPTITTAKPERPADYDGWWNHPVKIVFAGTDATSGLVGCDTIDYSGPDDPAGDVSGGCWDFAGNVATAHVGIKYDATPPTLTPLPAEVGSNEAVLHWSSSPDTVLTEITRSPGIGGAPASTVYSGTGDTFSDPSVKNDVTYSYSIRSSDAAANKAAATVTLTPTAAPPLQADAAPAAPAPVLVNLTTPSAGTPKLPGPPRLHWRRVKGADYYNVQIYRGTKKILSLWPKSTYLQLRMRWRFHGRLMQLTPARYDWYVWPGFGRLSRHRYGHLIVHKRFTFAASEAAEALGAL